MKITESMLQRILLNPGRSVVSFANVANVPPSTVGTWMKNYKIKKGKTMKSNKKN